MENQEVEQTTSTEPQQETESVQQEQQPEQPQEHITLETVNNLINTKLMEFKDSFFFSKPEDKKEETVEQVEEENYNDW